MVRWSVGTCVGLATLVLLTSDASHAQGKNLNIGTWKANLVASKYSPGPAPKSVTRTWEDRGDGVLLFTSETINAQGNTARTAFAFKYDGKDYPLAQLNATQIQTVAQRRIDPYTVELTFKTDGKTTITATETISKDGKTMTFQQKGTNAGQVPFFL